MSYKESENGFNDEEDDAFEGVGGHGETAYFSSIEVEEGSGVGTTFVSNEKEFVSEEFSEPIVTPVSVPKKSTGTNKFVIIGGLIAVFLLFLGGLGGLAWYVSQRGSTSGEEIVLPTPVPSVEVTPSIEPTPNQLIVNENSNSNINSNSNVNSQPSETPVSTPVGTTTQPTATPTRVPGRDTDENAAN